ncbi:MAG: protein-export chaperone SecB [Alphaproteobacteria bacterium]|nr:protein-export chaperone SecB [Alphaproteobacteria bacterium]
MNEAAPTPQKAAPGGDPGSLPIRFLGQYVRDLSFEAPHAPGIFADLRQQQHKIGAGVEPQVRHIAGSQFEVSLTAQVEAKAGDRPAFVAELVYCAMVELDERAVPQEHLHPLLLIEIPRFLFPFVRQIINDMTVSGGFPPLIMQPIDFVDLYRRTYGDKPQSLPRNTATT